MTPVFVFMIQCLLCFSPAYLPKQHPQPASHQAITRWRIYQQRSSIGHAGAALATLSKEFQAIAERKKFAILSLSGMDLPTVAKSLERDPRRFDYIRVIKFSIILYCFHFEVGTSVAREDAW
ncbi:Uu.00g067710.m01.CDS01 [Anthostomella pinea]|uniref:Uu.00g067710.m01.CDS01 n=1 Tax=Anthostomella pinea TaxID=933095 RepID=A0AAI8VU78_9PEZI|nr:Uu.00g067710.m01.CDS01 [Anthostomella pinea]